MDRLEYRPIDLEHYSFRLIRLFKRDDGPIQCELFDAQLYDAAGAIIEYEALSYTWGGMNKPCEIEINGQRMPVTENLHLALLRLRSPHEDRILWIDALCIDQDNDEERGHQVRQMASIYERAEQVVIWLGGGTAKTDLVFHYMYLLEQEIIKRACNSWKASDDRWSKIWSSIQPRPGNQYGDLIRRQQEGVKSLLGRSWFKRVWIIQEVAKARAAKVMCGAESVSARIFSLIPPLVGITPDPHCQAILDIMPGPTRKYSWWTQSRGLHTLLLKFEASQASDQRDKIYALLGVSSDGCEFDVLVPNYEKPEEEVVQATISFIFHHQDYKASSARRFPRWTVLEFLQNLSSLGNEVLFWAAKESHQATVEELLRRRDVDIHYSLGRALLLQAVASGNSAIAKLLLDKGVGDDINLNSLQVALANRGAKVDAQGEEYWKALFTAAERDGPYHHALQAASYFSDEQMIKLLLDEGEDINAHGGRYHSALQAAAVNGSEQVVKLLLNKGAFVNAQGGHFDNPLQAAVARGHVDVATCLLDSGADFNAQGGKYGSALQAARDTGNDRMVKQMLSRDGVTDPDSALTTGLRESTGEGMVVVR